MSSSPFPKRSPSCRPGCSVVDLSWPQRRIAVVLDDMPLAEIDEMTAAGWVVHRADGETDRLVAGIVSSMAEDG